MRKKGLSVLLLLFLMCGLFSVTVHAADAHDGLQAVITADKESYAAGETAQITITVVNDGTQAVSNVKVQGLLPEGLELTEDSETSAEIASLAPGEKLTLNISVVAVKDGVLPDQPGEIPATGDSVNIWAILLPIFAILFVAVLVICNRSNKQRKAFLSFCAMVLVFANIGTACVLVTTNAEEGTEPEMVSFRESKEISIDGTAYTVEAVVTYEKPVETQDPYDTYENGLWADYYLGTNLSDYVISEKVDTINATWQTGVSPQTGLQPEFYSIRYTGRIKADYTAQYTFTTTVDDGVKLYIDGQELINDAGPHYPEAHSGKINLVADTYYDITVEYYNGELGGSIRLEWECDGLQKQVVPKENLFLPKYPAEVSFVFDDSAVIATAMMRRENKEGYTLVVEKYAPDGTFVETVTKAGEGENVWNLEIEANTEEAQMATYTAYVLDKEGNKASYVVSRKFGEDYNLVIDAGTKTGDVSTLLYGACMEDVNHELYGGIWSQMIFGESFEEAPILSGSGFSSAGGSWYPNTDVLAIDNTPNGPKYVINDTQCSEGYIEADVRYWGEGAGFIIKVSDAKEGADNFNGYEISLFRDGVVKIGKHRYNYEEMSVTNCASAENTWTRLRAEFTEDQITIYVNGEKVTTFTDGDPIRSGELGFRAWNATAEYKNVKIGVNGTERTVDLTATNDFSSAGGSWYLNTDVLAIDNTPNGPKLVIDDTQCNEGYMEADVRYWGEGAGFIIKVGDAKEGADNFNGYEISLFRDGVVKIGKHRYNYEEMSVTNCASAENRWTRLRVEFTENEITIYVNGEKVKSFTDGDSIRSGELGFRTWNATAEYKNVTIGVNGTERTVDLSAINGAKSIAGMWEGETNKVQGSFTVTTENPFTGTQSQRMEFISGTGSISLNNMGLNRSGMSFLKDKDYRGYIYARSQSPVTVYTALESADGSRRYAESSFTVNGDWSKYAFTMVSGETDNNGRFVIELRSQGAIELGYAFLEPGEWGLYKGLHVRKDVGEMLENQGITVLRFGGCMINAADYKWKNMLGAPETRGTYRGWWYTQSSYGFGIFEFLELCEALDVIAVPDFNSYESASDMADFIQFACGTDENNQWVQLRQEMGHPDPFTLTYLEIGNEDKIDLGFANRFNAIANAIWELNSEVILVAGDFEYSTPVTDPYKFTGNPSGITTLEGHKQILDNAAAHDREVLFDVHIWTQNAPQPYNALNCLLTFYDALRTISPEAETGICVFELNANNHTYERALCNAFAISFAERHSDIIRIMTSANALQVQGQNDNGWDQGLLFMDNDSTWYQAPAYIDRMYLDAYLPTTVGVESDAVIHSDSFDATVTASEDGKTVCVKIINRSGSAKGVILEIPAFAEKNASLKTVVYADSLNAENTNNAPENTKPAAPVTEENVLTDGSVLVSVDGYSVTVLTFTANE